jgi:hypothetical protein
VLFLYFLFLLFLLLLLLLLLFFLIWYPPLLGHLHSSFRSYCGYCFRFVAGIASAFAAGIEIIRSFVCSGNSPCECFPYRVGTCQAHEKRKGRRPRQGRFYSGDNGDKGE